MAAGKILELSKTLDAGIDGARKSAQRHFEFVAGVDHQCVRRGNQYVPVGGVDIGADLPRRIGFGIAERDDLLLPVSRSFMRRLASHLIGMFRNSEVGITINLTT